MKNNQKKGSNWTAYYDPDTGRFFAEIMYTSREGREQYDYEISQDIYSRLGTFADDIENERLIKTARITYSFENTMYGTLGPERTVWDEEAEEARKTAEAKQKKDLKVIFLDYTGTMVQEDEPYTRELLSYFASHSDMKSPKEILKVIWHLIKEIEAESHGDGFLKNDEKIERILQICTEKYGLNGDWDHIHEVWRKVWVHAPLYDDVRPFFERIKLPVYVLSNDDLCYLEESMKLKDLHPAGIISAETARACKPCRDIFDKALEIAGVKAEEAVFIGDSFTSDIEPALKIGITPIYISRKEDAKLDGVRTIRTLDELF